MIRAAGILLLTPDNRALFLKRSAAGDQVGTWCTPGGKIEDGEDAEAAARRELREETGLVPKGKLQLLTRTVSTPPVPPAPADALPPLTMPEPVEQVDFTTFVLRVGGTQEPELNEEHDGYAWAPVASPPEPLHPGVRQAIARLSMDELGVARALAAGELASPQHYHNVALYCMRVTGTGVSYRPQLEEFCLRLPENYLTQEFLDRCNGLPVILHHPTKAILDSKEFGNRVVGTVMLPYIKGDEVWAVCKIYDKEAITLLEDEVMSTSPSVLLGKSDKLRLEDGTKLLVEGKPTLLDHLAIVPKGVWDKGGEASGIEQELAMADEDKGKKEAEEKARADAAARADEKLDTILAGVDSLSKRVDACNARMDAKEEEEKVREDKARKDAEDLEAQMQREDKGKKDSRKDGDNDGDDDDPEAKKARELAADKAKKDSEEEEEKKKADAARADAVTSTIKSLQDEVAALRTRIPLGVSDQDYAALSAAQARADDIFVKLGERAPRPLSGESVVAYRRRVSGLLKKHSERWSGIDLDTIAADAFDKIEPQVYADALEAAKRPNDLAKGVLREHTRMSDTGHKVTEFFGAEDTHFVRSFARPAPRVRGFTTRN